MRPTILILTLLTTFYLTGCSVNPVTGKNELSFISASREVDIGKKNYVPYQQQQGGRYSVDPDVNRYVADVGNTLARLSGRPNLPYEFVVLNNGVPNAWALPGGKIAINRGLLMELEDEAQLAAVLGHEIVHAAGKHSVQKMQQSILLGIGVQATAIAAQGTEYGRAAAAGAGLGAGLWSARYGREQELESDAYGIDYMVKAGYDPMAAVELQETFLRLSKKNGGGSNWLQGLFASHPPSQERVNKNRAKAQAIGPGGVRNREAFQQAIAQMKKDKKAYEDHQSAMKAAAEGNNKKALTLIDSAIKRQPEDALFHSTKGQILLAEKQDSGAAKAFTKARTLDPDYYMGHLGLGLIQKKQKRHSQAKQSLITSTKLLPTQVAIYHLGEIELGQGNKQAAIQHFSTAAQQGGPLGEQASARLQSLQSPQ
ncbi:M48 family metalloprotease [Agarilytica rhodophyticola]|uniref:M48 family metalloprotease n=1 Tax=Agarilytica rhodophyticola TaxID=1737490 RepID=UPI000B34284A|nr:M48 family metalloprotease [Agarilytica rhodophyticola]